MLLPFDVKSRGSVDTTGRLRPLLVWTSSPFPDLVNAPSLIDAEPAP
jgi:hypothetical protein